MAIVEQIHADPLLGLTPDEVIQSRREFGRNEFTPLPTKSAWDLFRDAFDDPMLKILIVLAVLSLGVGLYHGSIIDGVAILVAVLVVTAVGTYNQVRAQRDYTALDVVAQREKVRVVRSGQILEVDASELVRGDIVEINTGDIVPADGKLLRGIDVLVNEAHITGEPDALKQLGDEIYGSSRVLDGSGRAVIEGVGDATLFGKVRQEIGERDKETPLQQRLDHLAARIGKVGTWAAALTFFALLGSGIVRGEADPGFNVEFAAFVLDAMTIAITIIVVAVPEGLPLAVTLSLAYTTRRMAQDKALVRELSACETMGAATVVCSDKTGTLTAGAMTLHSADIGGSLWSTEQLSDRQADLEMREGHRALVKGIAVNSSADLIKQDGVVTVAGNSTEGALLRWLDAQGISYRALRDASDIVARREFNSTRKHMLTVVREDDALVVHMKGAPEIVLSHCDRVMTDNGILRLDEGQVATIIGTVRSHAERGHRTLGFASATIPPDSDPATYDQNLVFTGLFVIADPIRPEVADAVDRCRRAGVRVMIITGDIHETAQEIGRQSRIATDGARVLEGATFREMTDEQVLPIVEEVAVLSRALPEDKRRMVELLQAKGNVVAVTGDGVNDAPALVAADIGFSMGSGSKVAREASDIVIVDDNFASLVRAIRWGRSVFENIRKFLQFQLTVNVVALTTAFVAAMAGYGTPLTAVQLLWVNLIMDSLAALALALEPPTDELYDQPPHGRMEPLISVSMWINVLAVGAFMFAVLLVILVTDVFIRDVSAPYRYTFLFNVFVWMQIWNELNCRSTRFYRSPFSGLTQSRSFLGVLAVIVLLQVLIVQFGGRVFSTVPLGAGDWARSIAIGATVLIVGAFVRFVGRLTPAAGTSRAALR